MESSYQPILPGLPDDLALRCLAKIPHGYHGCLEAVSKRWRDVLRSTEYSSYKAREGWSGDWVFLLIDNDKDQWIAYDPDADRWHPIPMIPRKEEYAFIGGFGCVCVGNRFLVIGGEYCKTGGKPFVTNQVFQFDTFTKEWSEAACMRTPRTYFGCCVMSGKVYVCGGRNESNLDGLALVEVYDPLTNKWEEVPPMRNNQVYCTSLWHDGKLYVTDQIGNTRARNDTPICEFRTQIFDPSKQVWRAEQMNWPCSTYGAAFIQITEDGQMYADVEVMDDDNVVHVVKIMDNRSGELHALPILPYLPSSPDGISWGEGLFRNGFVALGNELYIIGGIMPYEGGSIADFKVLESDRCWIWDGKWRETRRMCRPSRGPAKAVAALKETNMSTT